MHTFAIIILLSFTYSKLKISGAQNSVIRAMPITVKDVGVVSLKKGDVAMIFYITVTNTGHEPIRLSVNGTRCCQRIAMDDEDCESMKIIGGDMGNLFTQDSRNLTLVYVNLYPYNRVGSCDVDIKDDKRRSQKQSVNFNTTLVKGLVPRLLEEYYEPGDIMSCKGVDKDPMNQCKPYTCDIRYDGIRSLYNYVTERCEKIQRCMGDPANKKDLVAYDVETKSCKKLTTVMTERDFAEFKEGKPSVLTLSHEHGYPINVRCHNGQEDKKGHWCECEEGWSSAPFDHKMFNPDIQVYHMCTVWNGELTAEQAKNITVLPKSQHKKTNIIIFTFLGLSFFFLLPVFVYLLYKLRLSRKLARLDPFDESEMAGLTANTTDSD